MSKIKYQLRTFKDCVPFFFLLSFTYIGVCHTLSIFGLGEQTASKSDLISGVAFGLFMTLFFWWKQKKERQEEKES